MRLAPRPSYLDIAYVVALVLLAYGVPFWQIVVISPLAASTGWLGAVAYTWLVWRQLASGRAASDGEAIAAARRALEHFLQLDPKLEVHVETRGRGWVVYARRGWRADDRSSA